jgi:hypothetical protein
LANGGSQANATAAATNITNLNLADYSNLFIAVPNINYPAANTVQVTMTHNLPLFLAPVIGLNSGAVNSSATAQFFPVATIPPNTMAPLAIYCNNQAGCTGALNLNQNLTTRRYCGNYFANGPSGKGITFNNNNSNNQFRSDVRDGYGGAVSMGQLARALPGNRNGWRDGMIDRLAAPGGNEVILPVIQQSANPSANYNIEILDFIKVRISNFSIMGNTDQTTFEIIQSSISATDFAESIRSWESA